MDNSAFYGRVCAVLGDRPVSETEFNEIQSRAAQKPPEQSLIDAMRVLGIETCKKIIETALTATKGKEND